MRAPCRAGLLIFTMADREPGDPPPGSSRMDLGAGSDSEQPRSGERRAGMATTTHFTTLGGDKDLHIESRREPVSSLEAPSCARIGCGGDADNYGGLIVDDADRRFSRL